MCFFSVKNFVLFLKEVHMHVRTHTHTHGKDIDTIFQTVSTILGDIIGGCRIFKGRPFVAEPNEF